MKKMSNPVHFEKTLSSETLFEGRVITLTKDTALLENGRTATREVVHHHGGACILPYFADGTICMVRQFRYAMQQELWELPAGKLEQGEDPFEAAKRELEEECGLTADHYTSLGEFYPTVGYDTEIIYTWVATGLHETHMHLDADEFLTPDRVPLEKAARNSLIRCESSTLVRSPLALWLSPSIIRPTQKPSNTWAMAGMVLKIPSGSIPLSLYMCAGVRTARSTIESIFVSL